MKVYKLVFSLALGLTALALTACASNSTNAQLTRVATQTPLIVFVPVTTTPEPATFTPLPTVTPEIKSSPTRTQTRVVARPTATKAPPTAPVAAGPSPTPAPVCSYGPPVLFDPNDGAERRTFDKRAGSDTFIFKWTPPPSVGSDDSAYKIQMDSKTVSGKPAGGDTVYISHFKFMSEAQGQKFIYDAQRVHNLPREGEDTTVTWYMTIVKFTGTINDLGYLTGTAVECSGSRTAPRTIILRVLEG